MERYHRSHKHGRNERERHHKRKDPEKHFRREHRHSSKDEARDGAGLEAESRSGLHIVSAKSSEEGLVTSSSVENNYVQRWLNQTDNDGILDSVRGRELSRSSELGSSFGLPPSNRGIANVPDFIAEPAEVNTILSNFLLDHDPGSLDEVPIPAKRKRRHDSTDSSLIEVSIQPREQASAGRDKAPEEREKRRHDSRYTRKKQRDEHSEQESDSESSGTSQASSEHIWETFEKRLRYKTREDRYEPKKKNKKDESAEKRPRTKRERKGIQKSIRRSGQEIMSSFNSPNIGQDRLTVRSQ